MAKKSAQKKREWSKPKLWLLIVVMIFAVLFIGSLVASYHQRLLVSQISVEGNKTVSKFDIRQVVNKELSGKFWLLYPKRNALLYPRNQVIAAVAKTFPRLSSIKLEQKDLQTLVLTVKERQGIFLWCLNIDDCYFADDTGFVFAPAPKFSAPLYFEFLVSNNSNPIGKHPLSPADFKKLVEVKNKLAEVLIDSSLGDSKIIQVAPAELRDWYYKVQKNSEPNQSWDIRIDLDQDFKVALTSLKAVLVDAGFAQDLEARPDKLEYIDLRFAPKVFYRYNK